MRQAFYILFGALFTLGVSYSLGKLLFQRLRLRLYRQEEPGLALVVGASLLHLILFALTAAGLARKNVFFAAGIAILVTAWMRGAWRRPELEFPPLPRFWKCTAGVAFAAYGFLYLVTAMLPEISPDGSNYHLGLVARYLREHRFPAITTNMYANLTQGIEMLYMFAFAFGRHSAAAVVHCGFTLALPLMMVAYGRRMGFPAAGTGAALFVLCSPVVGRDGTTAYIDVASAAVVFAVFVLLEIWRQDRVAAWIVPIGLAAGYCFAAKYTIALAIPYAGAILAWRLYRWRQPVLKPLAAFGACVLLMAGPWAAKNWITVWNPLSPFFNRYFPNPYVRISFEEDYIRQMRKFSGVTPAEVPMEILVKGDRLAGMVGPLFALAPLGLLALRRAEGRRLLLAGLIFLIPFFNNIGTRFLIPALPFLTLAFTMAVERSKGMLPLLVVAHMILSWPHVVRKYSLYSFRIEGIPVAAALRFTNEERYLSRRSPGYLAARMVEDFVPPGERVFSFGGIPESYTTREYLVAYQAGFNNAMGEILWPAVFPETAPVVRRRFQFTPQPVERLRLRLVKTHTERWCVNEFRIFHDTTELERTPDWRLTAWPNPWDVQMAFDNNPVTRWNTWETPRPGMFIEVNLAAPRTVDSVILEVSGEQQPFGLELYGRTPDGKWTLLSDKPIDSAVATLRGLRRAAVEELRANGIRYLLVQNGDVGDEDLRINAELWGVTQLAERSGARLYRLEAAAESKGAGK